MQIKNDYVQCRWIKLLEEPIEEAYSATNQELLEIAARKYWVRASSLHDANRFDRYK